MENLEATDKPTESKKSKNMALRGNYGVGGIAAKV